MRFGYAARMARIAFMGLGKMGSGMAGRLLAAGPPAEVMANQTVQTAYLGEAL